MDAKCYVTTSWDDGNPADFRVAELLHKYGISGTFYIPQASEYSTMSAMDVRTLSSNFEIGAHTLNHIILTASDASLASHEIRKSKEWLEDLLGTECPMFCFPQGKYRQEHVAMVKDAGYRGARTVEMMATRVDMVRDDLVILPTTVQAFEHNRSPIIRNVVKRRSIEGIWTYVRSGAPLDWPQLSRSLFDRASHASNGVFHLWGHSWELEQHSQWNRLETVLAFLAGHNDRTEVLTNGDLCRRLQST
jgi:peptidoglycan/xylan/chitin deacetylase (PgdA/CDA1 family)